MKGNSLLALGACFLLASCAEPATAPQASSELTPGFARGGRPFTPGEQQPKVDLTRGPLAIGPVGKGQNLAQTFSPTKNRKLGFIELPVGCAPDVLLSIKIRDGLGGTILFEAEASGLPVTVDGSFQLIQVYDPATTSRGIKIRKNHTYAFELAALPNPLVPDNPNSTCGLARGPAGDSYARGEGYFDAPPNDPGFIALLDGGDLPFITLVR